jgi:hypothetical protein
MIPKKHVPDVIRGGFRFLEKIVRQEKPSSTPIQCELIGS